MSDPGPREPLALRLDLDELARNPELRAILELAPIAIGIVDLEGRTVLTNDALRDLLGYSEEEFATLHWEAFTHPDDAAENQALFDEMVAGRLDRFELDKRYLHRDGHLVRGRLMAKLLRDDDGAPSHAIGLTEDVTARYELEEQLRHAEETYRLLVEESPAVVYVAQLDLSQPWVYVSPRLERLLGVPAEEWMAGPDLWWELMAPEDQPRIERLLEDATEQAVRTGGGDPQVLHYRMRHRDGRLR